MTIKINQSKDPPTRQQILDVESELGAKFPVRYVEFLNTYNGGVPETNIFKISEDNDSGINAFIPLDRIVYEADLAREQIGGTLVPIAYAEGGNYVCVATAGEDCGAIFFVDHEISGADAITKLAGSMEEFLKVLKPFDPKSMRAQPGQVKRAWINPRFLKK